MRWIIISRKELEDIVRMATNDALAPLNSEVAALQSDLANLQNANGQVLTYLQQILAQLGGVPTGSVNVSSNELQTAISNLTQVDTALQAVSTADTSAVPPPVTTTTPTTNIKK